MTVTNEAAYLYVYAKKLHRLNQKIKKYRSEIEKLGPKNAEKHAKKIKEAKLHKIKKDLENSSKLTEARKRALESKKPAS